jgi:threonyl-tRNA synthetase
MLCKELLSRGIRVEADLRNEKIGYKIREAQMEKVPYMLVIGDKEMENNLVAVRSRKEGELGQILLENFVAKILEEIKNKTL